MFCTNFSRTTPEFLIFLQISASLSYCSFSSCSHGVLSCILLLLLPGWHAGQSMACAVSIIPYPLPGTPYWDESTHCCIPGTYIRTYLYIYIYIKYIYTIYILIVEKQKSKNSGDRENIAKLMLVCKLGVILVLGSNVSGLMDITAEYSQRCHDMSSESRGKRALSSRQRCFLCIGPSVPH